jgi:L-fuconolactonase
MSVEPLVDTHVHVWDPRLLRYPWLEGEPDLARPVLTADIDRSAGATSMVFVQAAAEPEQALTEVEWVLAQDWPELSGIVADARLGAPSLPTLLETYAHVPSIVGVRHILQQAEPGAIDTVEMREGLQQVGEAGLTFDATVRADQLHELSRLHRHADSTVVILDHLGNPPVAAGPSSEEGLAWREGIERLAAQPRTAIKLSGVQWDDRSRPFFEVALDAFGVDRAMLGSDFPVTDPGKRRWDEVADILAPTAGHREALRSRTANVTYGLTLPSERTAS